MNELTERELRGLSSGALLLLCAIAATVGCTQSTEPAPSDASSGSDASLPGVADSGMDAGEAVAVTRDFAPMYCFRHGGYTRMSVYGKAFEPDECIELIFVANSRYPSILPIEVDTEESWSLEKATRFPGKCRDKATAARQTITSGNGTIRPITKQSGFPTSLDIDVTTAVAINGQSQIGRLVASSIPNQTCPEQAPDEP